MKTAASVLWTITAVAIGIMLVQAGMAQPTPPVPIASPSPTPSPTPTPSPEPLEPSEHSVEQWEKQVELDTNRAVHEAAAAKEAAKAAKDAARASEKLFDLQFSPLIPGQVASGFREAAQRVSNAPDEAAKEAAAANLLKLLGDYFESDMRVREQQLADIQSRVERLQMQLNHRRAKKQEIIDLQAKVAINEAEGLGFYGDRKPGGFDFAVPVPVVTPNTGTTISLPYGGKWTSESSSLLESATPAPASNAEPQ